MGVEMLLNALMKMCGFSKEQFTDGMQKALTEYEFIRERAISLDERVTAIENNQALILSNQALILSKLQEIQNSLRDREIPQI